MSDPTLSDTGFKNNRTYRNFCQTFQKSWLVLLILLGAVFQVQFFGEFVESLKMTLAAVPEIEAFPF